MFKLFKKKNKVTLVKVTVKEKYKGNFQNVEFIAIGILDSENSSHLYINPIRSNLANESFIGSMTRYPKNMIEWEIIK